MEVKDNEVECPSCNEIIDLEDMLITERFATQGHYTQLTIFAGPIILTCPCCRNQHVWKRHLTAHWTI